MPVADARRIDGEQNRLIADLKGRVAEAAEMLETANRELESFSYSVSHDLRAPVRAISGFATMLREDHRDGLDDEARRKLDIICSQADKMNALIDGLLSYSRLGRADIVADDLDMTGLARRAFDRLLQNADRHGEGIEFRLKELPAARGDRGLIEQVWIHLLSNAIKFSSKTDRPIIEVESTTEDDVSVYLVRDNGAGFDPNYQSKLFGLFQRLHDESDFPGTGVGLALVHRIVTRHGGRIWPAAQLDAGATFHFTLPEEHSDGRTRSD